MKIKELRSNKFFWPAMGIIIVLIIASAVYASRTGQRSPTTQSNSTIETVENYPGPTDAEQKEVEANKTKDGGPIPNPVPNTEPAGKSVTLSRADYDQTVEKLIVQSQLYGTGWQECTLDAVSNEKKVTKKAEALYQPDFSTCLGFSIDRSELSSGEWIVTLSVTNSDGQTYKASSSTISVK